MGSLERAIARAPRWCCNDPNSASAQFNIALRALPELDGRYAVFGRVTKGMDVVDKIAQGDKLISAKVLQGGTLVQDSK